MLFLLSKIALKAIRRIIEHDTINFNWSGVFMKKYILGLLLVLTSGVSASDKNNNDKKNLPEYILQNVSDGTVRAGVYGVVASGGVGSAVLAIRALQKGSKGRYVPMAIGVAACGVAGAVATLQSMFAACELHKYLTQDKKNS